MCEFARRVFLHQTRGKQQIHVSTQRWGIQKCVHSFPQAHAGSQKRVPWYQLTPTHKMAPMRLCSYSETLSARGPEKQPPPKTTKKILGSLRNCPFCFFLPREKYEQNNRNASDSTSRRECIKELAQVALLSFTPKENGSLLRAGLHQVSLLYQSHVYFYRMYVKNMQIIIHEMMTILFLLCSACKSWNWKSTAERVSTLKAKNPDTKKLWSSYEQKIEEIWEIIDSESVVNWESHQEDHPTGISPGAGLTFCESMEEEKDREMKHQVSSPGLAQSSWHHSIQFMAGPFGEGSPCPWSVWLVGQTHPIEGCPERPSIMLTHGPPKQAPSFGYAHSNMQRLRVQAVEGYIINLRKTTELRKKPRRQGNHSIEWDPHTCTHGDPHWEWMQHHGCELNKVCAFLSFTVQPPAIPVLMLPPLLCFMVTRWPVTRRAILLLISSPQEVQPNGSITLLASAAQGWGCDRRTPQLPEHHRHQDPAQHLSFLFIHQGFPPWLSCPPALHCLACRHGNFHILKLKHQGPQSDARQSAGEEMGPSPLSISPSASPCMLIHKCWRSLNLSPTMSWSLGLLFSLYLCGLKSVIALLPLSTPLPKNNLICVLPSLLPSFTTSWFMALDSGSSTQLKSHSLIIKRFRCFPVHFRQTVNNKMRAEQPQKHQRSRVFNFVPVTAALWHME